MALRASTHHRKRVCEGSSRVRRSPVVALCESANSPDTTASANSDAILASLPCPLACPSVNDILCHHTIDAVTYRLLLHLPPRSNDDSHSSPLHPPLETYRSSQSRAHAQSWPSLSGAPESSRWRFSAASQASELTAPLCAISPPPLPPLGGESQIDYFGTVGLVQQFCSFAPPFRDTV